MFWTQGAISFLLWIAYGVVQMRRSAVIRSRAESVPRARRGLLAAGMLVLAVVVLFGGLSWVFASGGIGKQSMTAAAWLEITILGLVFVHLQTLATALLVTMSVPEVTPTNPNSSTDRESNP